jgi:probable DNA repair protein
MRAFDGCAGAEIPAPEGGRELSYATMHGDDYPGLAKAQLFASLAAGRAGGVTVLTPNLRLAQALTREFDAIQAAQGSSSWESADILPYSAFVARCYEDALYSERGRELPVLLTPVQEQALWEDAIEASVWGGGALLALAQAADEARKAWRLAHLWRIDGALGKFPGNEDAEAFALWAADYRRRTRSERHIDAARLPDLVAGLLDQSALKKPGLLVVYAFDVLPRQTRVFFDACAAVGVQLRACGPEQREARTQRLAFGSAREELAAAACWARARLEANTSADLRIAIVVPDIEQRRKEVARVLSDTLAPDAKLPGAAAQQLPFNISLGVPLTDYALVHAALGLIELAGRGVDFALASRLLRSPFIAGAEGEVMQRARLDAALRRSARPQLTLARLLAGIGSADVAAPALLARLSAMFERARTHLSGRKPPQDWAQQFAALLQAAGFPGSRSLDSVEFQTHEKWNQALAEFARLGRVTPAIGFNEALARLRRLCSGLLFQPESGAAAIQVLGILESAGLEFDHLWVSGLTDEAWPLAARPNPFIPPALQKKAGIPEASAEGALALDRRITEDWLTAAGEVVLSHAMREQDRELAPSPLIALLPEGNLDLPAYPRYRDQLYAARALEEIADGKGPPLRRASPAQERAAGRVRVRGGARVLADQAACPFRAYARHRLAATPLQAPAPGLDAAARGTLLHALMKGVWDELKTKAALDAMSREDLAAVIGRAAAGAVAGASREHAVEERFAELERERLARLAQEWLALERERADFAVAATEDKRALVAGGLEFSGRIDRIDRLAGGGHALIDYKSGRVTPKYWEGRRPDDPQLPLYAVNAGETITAVAFAKLKTGGMRMTGYSRDDKALPRVKQYRDWDALLAGWRQEVDALGASFSRGEARVDPKSLAQTCRYCDLAPLCRVHEKLSALALDAGETAMDGAEEGEGE